MADTASVGFRLFAVQVLSFRAARAGSRLLG